MIDTFRKDQRQFGRVKSRSGLRNRFRTGRSTYSQQSKGRRSDRYGSYTNGRQDGTDLIAGHTLPLHKPKGAPHA